MQHSRTAEPSITMQLLNWAWHQLARRVLAMRAKHRAVAVAAYTAGTGNPPGA
jgi:hypothetical protein